MKLLLRYFIVLTCYGIITLFLLSFVVFPFITNKNGTVYLPDVRNYNIIKAENILENMNFKVEIVLRFQDTPGNEIII